MKNRQRGRNGKQRPPGRNPNYDGGNNRPRGNAQQLMEKYLSLARDATSAGDRVLAEGYFQHADHYYRVLNARFEQQNGQQRPGGQPQQNDYRSNYNDSQGDGGDGNQQYQGQQDSNGGQNYQNIDHQRQQQQHHQQQQWSQPEPEIGLPPGILGAGGNGTAENGAGFDQGGQDGDRQDQGHQDGGQNDGGRQGGGRHRGGRHRRGRGDRPVGGTPGE